MNHTDHHGEHQEHMEFNLPYRPYQDTSKNSHFWRSQQKSTPKQVNRTTNFSGENRCVPYVYMYNGDHWIGVELFCTLNNSCPMLRFNREEERTNLSSFGMPVSMEQQMHSLHLWGGGSSALDRSNPMWDKPQTRHAIPTIHSPKPVIFFVKTCDKRDLGWAVKIELNWAVCKSVYSGSQVPASTGYQAARADLHMSSDPALSHTSTVIDPLRITP